MTDKVMENNQVTVMGEIVAQRFIRQDTAYDLRKADGCFKGLQRNTRHGKRTVQVL